MNGEIEGVRFKGTSSIYNTYPPVYYQKGELRLTGSSISIPSKEFEELRQLGRDTLGDSMGMFSKVSFTYLIRNPLNGKFFFGTASDYNKDGLAYIPDWMFGGLNADYGDALEFCYVEVAQAEKPYIKLMPLTENFYNLKDPAAVLEEVFKNFRAVSVNFPFEAPSPENPCEIIRLTVVETKPYPSVTLLHGDTEVDFAPMPGYEEKQKAKAAEKARAEGKAPIVEVPVNNDDDDDDDDDDGKIRQERSTGHSLSNSKPDDHENQTLCKTCGKYVPNASYRLHSMRCARLYTKCPDCGKYVEKTALATHKKEAHTEVACPKCGAKVPEKALLEKHNETCPMAEVPCRYCKEMVARKDAVEHEDYCGSKTVLCEKCGKRVCRRNYDEHVKGGCADGRRTPSPLIPPTPSPPPHILQPTLPNVEEEKPVCPICGRKFQYYGNEFSNHVERCLGGGGGGGYRKDADQGMDRGHVLDGNLNFMCPICGENFGFRTQLDQHICDEH